MEDFQRGQLFSLLKPRSSNRSEEEEEQEEEQEYDNLLKVLQFSQKDKATIFPQHPSFPQRPLASLGYPWLPLASLSFPQLPLASLRFPQLPLASLSFHSLQVISHRYRNSISPRYHPLMRILNVSFKVISILESFALDFKNLAALGAKVSLALFQMEARPTNIQNTQKDKSNGPIAHLWCKMAFFKRA